MNQPESFKALPRYGVYPIPFMFYVNSDTKVPNFQTLDGEKIEQCYVQHICGLCGQQLGDVVYFVGGPVSCSTGTFFDPPAHRDCVEYAFSLCPYLLGQRDYVDLKKPADRIIPRLAPTPGVIRIGIFAAKNYIWGHYQGSPSFFATKSAAVEWRNRLCL